MCDVSLLFAQTQISFHNVIIGSSCTGCALHSLLKTTKKKESQAFSGLCILEEPQGFFCKIPA